MSQPQQRYTPVPGFGRSPLSASASASASSSGARSPSTAPLYQPYRDEMDEKYGGGSPVPNPASYELDNMYEVPPAHRASLYSDPFNEDAAAASAGAGMTSGASGHGWASRSRSSTGAGLGAAGAGAGIGSGAALNSGGNGYAHTNVPADELWAMDNASGAPRYAPVASTGMSKGRKRGLIIGLVLGALVLIAVIVAVVVTQVTKNKSSAGNSNAAASTTGNSTTAVSTNPANFTKDDRLHNVFYGFAYEPDGVILPECGATQANVTRDIQLLSQLTTRLHLYGSDCNETALVLQAIQDTQVNMSVWLAIYVEPDNSDFDSQLSAIVSALQTYGASNIEGIAVGNEYLLDQAGSVTSGSAYTTALDFLINKTETVNTTIKALGLDKYIPIGTADAGSVMSTALANKIDFFMANVHPWFGGLPIDEAAVWTWEYFTETDVDVTQQDVAEEATNVPQMYIAETGWPTASMNASEATDGSGSPQGDASVANLQTFLDTFVCAANNNGTKYFYFEAFDEAWKSIYGGVEPYWGLFDTNRNLKNVTIPTCS